MTQVLDLGQKVQEQQEQQSPALINFLESVNSEYTRKCYLSQLDKFMKFYNVEDPEDLLLWDQKVIGDNIIKFVIQCRKEGRAQNSIHDYYTAIKHFYEMNDVVLNWKKLKRFVGKANGKRAADRPYTHDEIKRMLDRAEPRMRVCLLLMSSGGLRKGAIPDLKVGDLRKIPEYNMYEVTVYRGEPEEYKTYVTPECTAAIDSYLEFRRRHQEKITENSYLIINVYNKHGVAPAQPKKISQRTLENLVYNLLYDSGIRDKENKITVKGQRYTMAQCHSARKFFASQLEHANMKDYSIETLLGHSTGLRGVYRKVSQDDLLQEYLRCMPHLIINEEDRLRQKVNKLTAEQDRIMKKLNKIDALAEKLGITDDDDDDADSDDG